jgi:hypothetical protein
MRSSWLCGTSATTAVKTFKGDQAKQIVVFFLITARGHVQTASGPSGSDYGSP